MNSDFAENLRLLAGYYPSIADVCRRIGLNRQQFNKYLSGQTRPSRHTLRRVCDFFGVEDYEIFMPSDEFRALIAVRPRRRADGKTQTASPYLRSMEALFSVSRADVGRYLGYYFTYRLSFSNPALVLKSLVHLWQEDDRVLSKRVERFLESDGSGTRSFLCKYSGFVLFLGDRIYVVEHEILGREEISETILYASYRNHVTWLSGLNTGVSTSDDRRIGCGQVLYQALGKKVDLAAALKRSGKYPLGSEEVPALVAETLCQSDAGTGSSGSVIFATPR
jgi:transcriptional regulator with XRE-family HTH domain